MPALHAKMLQLACIRFHAVAVSGQKHHMRAFLAQQPHQVHQPQRSRIMIGARRMRIDDQNLCLFAMQQCGRRYCIRRKLLCQCFTAVRGETLPVADLVRLHADAGVGAGGAAFGMDHARSRLVEHALAGSAHREREIGVFVIRRCVARVEAAACHEQRARDRDRCAAGVVAVAQIGEARIFRRFELAVVPAAAVIEDHAAGFLQTAVGIEQLRADEADIRMVGERGQQCVKPARLRDGVVIEKDQIFAPSERRAVVARGDKAAVLRAPVIAHPGNLR